MYNFDSLFDFIDRAEHSRNYPPNTAHGLKVALRLFEPELKPEERTDVAKFQENLDRIYQEVVRKNKKFTPGSLATYKYRILRVLSDFEKYGIDPTKMVNWKVETRSPRRPASPKKQIQQNVTLDEEPTSGTSQRIVHPLSGGSIVITLPQTVTAADMKKIKTLLELVETTD